MKNTQKNRKQRIYLFLVCINIFLILILVLIPKNKPLEESVKLERDEYSSQEDYIPDNNNTIVIPESNTNTKPFITETKQLAIVIDDVGYNLNNLDYFLKFPGPITFAILPNLPYSKEAAERIANAGKEVIIHMPMEAVNSGLDHGPGAIFVNMNEKEILELLVSALNSVPFAKGMNNHMGSMATTDLRVMNIVINFAKSNNLVFLDSLTSPDSIAEMVSEINQIPILKRNIFLDVNDDKESVTEQFDKGIEITESTNPVILIGHIQNINVINILNGLYPVLKENEIELKYLSELIKID